MKHTQQPHSAKWKQCVLLAVLFSDGFPAVHSAYRIPLSVVRQFVRKKGDRDVLFAQGPVLSAPGVEDITAKLR